MPSHLDLQMLDMTIEAVRERERVMRFIDDAKPSVQYFSQQAARSSVCGGEDASVESPEDRQHRYIAS